MASSTDFLGRTRYLLMAVDGGAPWLVKTFANRDAADREALRRNTDRDVARITRAPVDVPYGTAHDKRAPSALSPVRPAHPHDGGAYFYIVVETDQDRRKRVRHEIDDIRRGR